MAKNRASQVLAVAAILCSAAFGAWYLTMGRKAAEPVLQPVLLPKGTAVSLALLEPISSGASQEGDLATAIVLEDVKDGKGRTLIVAGTPTKVEVTRSRGSSAMTQLINQPARLTIRFTEVKAVDGSVARLDAEGKEELPVTREMAKDVHVGDAIQKLWNNLETQAPLKALQERLTGEAPTGELKAPDLKRAAEDVAREMNMPQTQKALENPQAWNALSDAVRGASKGDLSRLGSADAALALGALQELGSLAGTVGSAVKGVFKGSNITLPLGAKLKATLAEDVKVLPVPLKRGSSSPDRAGTGQP